MKYVPYFRLSNGDELYLCDRKKYSFLFPRRTLSISLAVTCDNRQDAIDRVSKLSGNWHIMRCK